jgi:hypothetical protein
VLLILGWTAIRGAGPWRRGRSIDAHQRLMALAFAVSTVFLGSYLEYHYRVGSVAFWGTGWLKALYLAVLVPHTVAAALMLPPILVTFVLAIRGRFDRHRALGPLDAPGVAMGIGQWRARVVPEPWLAAGPLVRLQVCRDTLEIPRLSGSPPGPTFARIESARP